MSLLCSHLVDETEPLYRPHTARALAARGHLHKSAQPGFLLTPAETSWAEEPRLLSMDASPFSEILRPGIGEPASELVLKEEVCTDRHWWPMEVSFQL